VADRVHRRLVVLDTSRKLHAIIGSARLSDPHGLAFFEKKVFIADPMAHALVVYNLSGNTPLQHVPAGAITDVAIDPVARLLYAADVDAGLILVRSLDDDAPWEPFCDASEAVGLALAPDRRLLYIADRGGPCINAIDIETGRIETVVKNLPDVAQICITPGGMIATAPRARALLGINLRHGSVQTLWTESSCTPEGVVFDKPGRAYVVTDSERNRVLKVAQDGGLVTEIEITLPGL
jgi:DNA-binding beta-propeller fold protein YncE